jgi:MFS family permease
MFVRHELSVAASGGAPLADLRLFRHKSFRYGNITVLIVMLGEFGVIFTLPLFCQVVLGFGTLTTGWVFASLSAGALVAGGTVPRLAKRFPLRTMIIGGMILEGGAAMTLALTLSADMGFWNLAPVLFVYGLGIGTASAQLTGAILADVPASESGQGSAIQSTSRQLGSVLGTAVLGSILAATISAQVSNALADVPNLPDRTINPLADAVAQSGGTAVIAVRDQKAAGAFAGRPEEPFVQPVIDASVEGYTQAVRITLGTGAAIILLGALSATRLPNRREDETDATEVAARA